MRLGDLLMTAIAVMLLIVLIKWVISDILNMPEVARRL